VVVTKVVMLGTTKEGAETAEELAEAIETMEGRDGSKKEVLANIALIPSLNFEDAILFQLFD
jgi:pyrimidine operon attenuation protein/uracil phosphoribosyltransferase